MTIPFLALGNVFMPAKAGDEQSTVNVKGYYQSRETDGAGKRDSPGRDEFRSSSTRGPRRRDMAVERNLPARKIRRV